MSLQETFSLLERRIEEAAKRLSALAAERATLVKRLEGLEAQVKAGQIETQRLQAESRGAVDLEAVEAEKLKLREEIVALQRDRAEADAKVRGLHDERKTLRERVEAMLARLDKLDLD